MVNLITVNDRLCYGIIIHQKEMSSWNYLKWTNEDRQVILSKYGKNTTSVIEDIKMIKHWMKKQPHLQNYPFLDHQIELLLILSKFRIEKVKHQIDVYFTALSHLPEPVSKISNKYLEKSFISTNVVMLPILTKDYARVFVSRLNEPNANLFDINDYMIRMIKTVELRSRFDCCLGDYYVLDCKWISTHHIAQLNFLLCKKLLRVAQEFSTSTCKGVYLINAPKIMENIFRIFKSLIKKKIVDRIYIMSDEKIIFDLLPKCNVPSEYGGDGMSIKELSDIWKKKFEEIDEWFEYLISNPVDESLRPSLNQFNDTSFGVDGHFRKLNID